MGYDSSFLPGVSPDGGERRGASQLAGAGKLPNSVHGSGVRGRTFHPLILPIDDLEVHA